MQLIIPDEKIYIVILYNLNLSWPVNTFSKVIRQ